MDKMKYIFLSCILLGFSTAERACPNNDIQNDILSKVSDTSTAQQSLKDHSKQFDRKEILKVTTMSDFVLSNKLTYDKM